MKLEDQVLSLLNQGQKLEAVKLYREQTGTSLLEAKNAVEAIAATRPQTDLLAGAARTPSPTNHEASDIEGELLRLLGQGEKLKAVKLWKETTGSPLMDSKLAVEKFAAERGIVLAAGAGCANIVVAIVALVLVAALVGIVWMVAGQK